MLDAFIEELGVNKLNHLSLMNVIIFIGNMGDGAMHDGTLAVCQFP